MLDSHDQFVLRVKHGGEVDLALRALLAGAKTPAELSEITNMARTGWLTRLLPDWFDNVHVKLPNGKDGVHELHYTDIMPHKVQIVTSDISIKTASSAAAASAPQDLSLQMVWPFAPPLISPMDNFDKPQYYDTMRTMVHLGRHIALEGPPGVGKDTVVAQLAADEGKPLVTIGGDAGFRRRDLTGSPQIANGTSYFNVSEYVAAAVNGWWVLLSEVNAADPDALMYINTQLAPPFITTLEGKAYPVHKDFRIFVTYNHGLIGTKPLPQSFKDRFFSIKVPFFTESQLRRRMIAMGMPDATKVAIGSDYKWCEQLVRFGVQMWDAHESGRIRYQISTRRLNDAVVLMAHNVAKDIRAALTDAVIAAIDSPVEQKAARAVLDNVLYN